MRAPAATPVRSAATETAWPYDGKPTAEAALAVCEAPDPPDEITEAAELAAPLADERRELIALLIGAVAVLAALATEELTLAALELAPWADDDRPAAIEEATEAGTVVATPLKVVVMRSEVVDAAEEESEEVVELAEDVVDAAAAEVEEALPDEGQAVLVPAEEQICW